MQRPWTVASFTYAGLQSILRILAEGPSMPCVGELVALRRMTLQAGLLSNIFGAGHH